MVAVENEHNNKTQKYVFFKYSAQEMNCTDGERINTDNSKEQQGRGTQTVACGSNSSNYLFCIAYKLGMFLKILNGWEKSKEECFMTCENYMN